MQVPEGRPNLVQGKQYETDVKYRATPGYRYPPNMSPDRTA